MRAAGVVAVALGVDAALLGALSILIQWLCSEVRVTLWPGIVFLGGIAVTLGGAWLMWWARYRYESSRWAP